jgi:DNA replication initiation complex subunit (GINS family)
MEKKEIEELLMKWEGSVPKNSIIKKYGDIDEDKVLLTMTLTDEEKLLFITIKATCKANIADVQNAIDMIEDKKVCSSYLK